MGRFEGAREALAIYDAAHSMDKNPHETAELLADVLRDVLDVVDVPIHQDWLDDMGNVRDADRVEVSWRVRDARNWVIFESDVSLSAEQAVGMFRGIEEVTE